MSYVVDAHLDLKALLRVGQRTGHDARIQDEPVQASLIAQDILGQGPDCPQICQVQGLHNDLALQISQSLPSHLKA